jgi:DNA repair protein RecO (recombination protein O)
MEWRDEGLLLSVRKHGETSAIIEVLTKDHGRCLGLVRGGRSRQMRPVLQPGNRLAVVWRARLEEHLGNFAVEPLSVATGFIIEHGPRLACVATIAELSRLLAEREPHPRVHAAADVVIDMIADDEVWPALLVRWELGLLDELGFGLDLATCAATGAVDELVYVSPKTGRAVSRGAGEEYHDRLLSLPAFLRGGNATPADVARGLKLSGHFLQRHVIDPRGLQFPPARQSILDWLAR